MTILPLIAIASVIWNYVSAFGKIKQNVKSINHRINITDKMKMLLILQEVVCILVFHHIITYKVESCATRGPM